MPYFVYIIYSEKADLYYKGFTENPEQRLIAHNTDETYFTAGKGPWKIVYLKEFPSKREALIEEKRIKKLNRKSIETLISVRMPPCHGLVLRTRRVRVIVLKLKIILFNY